MDYIVPRRSRRRALTLVEMLVAMTCILVMMAAITKTFAMMSEASAKGRAAIELSTQLRNVRLRLQEDLQNITVPMRPWADAEGGAPGYAEFIEGQVRDMTNQNANDTRMSFGIFGDFDDILAMTVRSPGEPFVGRYEPTPGNVQMIQSDVAEVIWFPQVNDKDGDGKLSFGDSVTLYRRVLLVRPDLPLNPTNFFQRNDISARRTATGIAPNSLDDLSRRENRFAHLGGFAGGFPTGFPNALDLAPSGFLNNSFVLQGDRLGEDVMLTSILGFDFKVYDSYAPVRQSLGGETVVPGDPGFRFTSSTVSFGAFVDLRYGEHQNGLDDNGNGTVDEAGERNYFTPAELNFFSFLANGIDDDLDGTIDETDEAAPPLSLRPNAKSQLLQTCYDTWSMKYERDGFSQNGSPVLDQGTNGLDDNNNGQVDEVEERETSPPYPFPLRGIQVRIRVLESDSRQVRQASIVQDFIPE